MLFWLLISFYTKKKVLQYIDQENISIFLAPIFFRGVITDKSFIFRDLLQRKGCNFESCFHSKFGSGSISTLIDGTFFS